MGSKTLENEGQREQDRPPAPESSLVGGEPRGCHLSRDGDGCMGSNGASGDGGDDDDDEDEAHDIASLSLTSPAASAAATGKKKKRKRPKKKNKAKAPALKQSSPPRIPVHHLFPSGEYPAGELLDHGAPSETMARSQAAEQRHRGRQDLDDAALLRDYRQAAEVHRQVRRWVQETVRPGQTLAGIAAGIDDGVRALLGNAGLEPGQGLRSGLGFPTGLSLNNCVAHYTPNPGHRDVALGQQDVLKVDFGVHVNGWIVDSAFTMSFDPTYDNLLAAVKDATNTGIKNAGVDVRISDISAAIQEAMESYEVEIRGKTFPVKAVRSICGHNIKQYRIHGDKTIPFVRNSLPTKMEEGDIFAIETFGSTGRGFTRDAPEVYGYGLKYDAPKHVSLPLASANRVYKTIRENFGTIVFCRRYLERLGCERYLAGLNSLVSNGILESYPPLMDSEGSYSAQFEHTILLRESTKEVISRGDDY